MQGVHLDWSDGLANEPAVQGVQEELAWAETDPLGQAVHWVLEGEDEKVPGLQA